MTLRIIILISIIVIGLMISLPFISANETGRRISTTEYIQAILGHNAVRIANVRYYSSGCFHYVEESIELFGTDSSFVIHYTHDRIHEQNNKIIDISGLQKDALLNFINQLADLKEEEGCTTVDSYYVSYKRKNFKKIDGSCGRNGYHTMKKTLKLD